MQTFTVHGHYAGQTFVPDGPLPVVEGSAELIITPASTEKKHSMFESFGKASLLRTREDIEAQLREDREEDDL